MYKLVELIEQHREVLATIETWDNGELASPESNEVSDHFCTGKTYTAAYNDDLGELLAVLKYYAGWADKNSSQGENLDIARCRKPLTLAEVIETTPAKFCYTIAEPIGVCAQIIPWNYPLGMASWKLGPALAAGNTMILKAAEQTPLSILYLATLIKDAGFPPGVVNILNGRGAVAGAALAAHMDVDKIGFTGSTATGREIMKAAAGNLKNITIETGGKSPLIVFEDANLDAAVKYGHYGIMGNAGQVCTANSRIFVHENVYADFVTAFKKKTDTVSVLGDPFDNKTWQGPLVSKAQCDRVLSYIDSGKRQGAKIELGGKRYTGLQGKGYYVQPTVFADVREDMDIYREEIFGPVATIIPFATDDDAIRMANDTTYGLAAALFTENVTRAHRVSRRLEAGSKSCSLFLPIPSRDRS